MDFAPMSALNFSVNRCIALPMPELPYEYFPGFARSSSMNSFRLFAGTSGAIPSMPRMVDTFAIGAKSAMALYGKVACNEGAVTDGRTARKIEYPFAGARAIEEAATI